VYCVSSIADSVADADCIAVVFTSRESFTDCFAGTVAFAVRFNWCFCIPGCNKDTDAYCVADRFAVTVCFSGSDCFTDSITGSHSVAVWYPCNCVFVTKRYRRYVDRGF
jgi:hypothetical protein